MLCYRNIRRCRQFNKKQQTKDGESDEDKGSQPTAASSTAVMEAAEGAAVAQKPLISIMDNTECKFKMNSIKIMYVVNSETCLYKRLALQRAKQVSVRPVKPLSCC